MVENMEPDQSRVQVAVGSVIFAVCFRFRHPFTNCDAMMTTNGGGCQEPPR
jgi:hypothetical protein